MGVLQPARAFSTAREAVKRIRVAAAEFTWLLSRGYAGRSALKLVGDRHSLEARQRMAIMRSACSDEALQRRREREVPLVECRDEALGIDGYNLLVTIESALSGGIILVGRARCCRDLARMHGTYRKVEETTPAIERIAAGILELGVAHVDWYFDKPVSNSGRLKALMADVLEERGWLSHFNIELVDSPDQILSDYDGVVVTADGPVLDRCARWTNLAAGVIATVSSVRFVELF